MTSKYEMAARARKKKRTVSSLGQAMLGKKASQRSPKAKPLQLRQAAMRAQAKKMQTAMTAAQKRKKMMANKKKPLTAAQKRKRQQMKAKMTTAQAKASAAAMDKRIAKIKKEK